ncbi:hypothetical protein LEP1GSC103_2857 [Leptospira borgpetersenii serovar Javanica str. UI 09931]|uniref:Uncharacterized protein n=4 Tax=Leptospira borgpetersenii TaxID=174 RepID=M3GKC7_LEPBO|nr:hypothetical protein LBBP_00393 [Leptospira borgpetersenii serovar Ballum]AXX14461.1 hypothetical protein C4Q31_01685 [Leptospira borgpetersenii serovar Ceylonica]EKP12929.1 hypothetical protein LEP1GSC128_3234 [Leptospira borgpetersenii str. 200801926]EKQ98835.1 hypothetical protein LEP1GSC121_0644 [Leptospira borgpetersenii serovar Castellonis str. 200801910]EMG01442.1 hypothetical protein LEP1GSC123_4565 [Leptospira borgpetersenii str. 200701203]ENO65517.1 hypothetical protein LEP1GSC191
MFAKNATRTGKRIKARLQNRNAPASNYYKNYLESSKIFERQFSKIASVKKRIFISLKLLSAKYYTFQ